MARRRPRSASSGMDLPLLTVTEAAVQKGMAEAARRLLKESNARAPVDDGTLRRSGRVVVDDLTVQVGYTAPHAHLQHEALDYAHEDGGEAKFLELAADAFDMDAIVVAVLRGELSG